MRYTGRIGIAAALLLVAAGCGKKEGGAGDAATGTLGKDSPRGGLGSDLGSAAGEAASAASQKLADTFSSQVRQQQEQLDTLKQSAKQYADQELNGLLAQLDTELASATTRINELKSAGQDGAKAIQSDFQDIMAQVTDLVDQATSRLAELGAAKP
jgi:DNA anti-recombination protein RmuC